MESNLLTDVVVIYGLAAVIVYVSHLVRLPAILGFILTGMVVGPSGLGLVASQHEVELLAEMGVVLLLFGIGLEFSPSDLARMARPMFLGGGAQVGLTVAAGLGVGWWLGLGQGPALFLGFLVCLSSTAIVLKQLQAQAMLDSPPGRTSLAMLLFQDLAVVGMLLAAPLMSPLPAATGQDGWWLVTKGLVVVGALGVGARWVVPWFMARVADSRNRELFIIAVASLVLGVAWLTAWAGISLALGAFLAGLILSASPYSHQALGQILPLRDLFTSLFFVSIGMLMELDYLVGHPLAVGGVALAIMAGKALLGAGAALTLGLSLRVATAVGLMIGQVGEFSFVLAKTGLGLDLISRDLYQLFLDAAVLSMAATPAAMRLGQFCCQRPGLAATPRGESLPPLRDHVIIVGYGLCGRNVARAAQLASIPAVVLEMNPSTVKRLRAEGQTAVYGDAVNPAVLEHVGVERARVLVCTMADPVATRRVVAQARAAHPELCIIARTRFLQELPELQRAGADEVIPEEYETSLEIFARLLRRFLFSEQSIEKLSAQLRADDYQDLRAQLPPGARPLAGLESQLAGMRLATLEAGPGAPAVGKSLGDLDLRAALRATVLAHQRQGELTTPPDPSQPLAVGDLLLVMAAPEDLLRVRDILMGRLTQDQG